MSERKKLEEEISRLVKERQPHAKIRALRMQLARLKGRHTNEQWQQLCQEFDGRCVRCGAGNRHLDRDHIIPVYKGGSDGIDNLQPLCARCNASKGPETFDWAALRRVAGFE